jgi:hypothetical protein
VWDIYDWRPRTHREAWEKKPLSIVVVIILLKASMTTTKRKGNRGSLCLNPWVLLKKPAEEPFTKKGEANGRYAMHYPKAPFLSETTPPHHVRKEIPANMVKSLYNI